MEIRLGCVDGIEIHLLRRLNTALARLEDEVRLRECQLNLTGRKKLGGMVAYGLETGFSITVPADKLVDGVGGDAVGTPVEAWKD